MQKYSLYANIILLDVDGNVLLQLDANNPVRSSSDLLPGQAESLIYSYRVTSRDGGRKLGVMCLCFRFANETEGIFANLVGPADWSVATLLDRGGVVIASSDPYHVPVGAQLDYDLACDWKVARFGGRKYLSVTRATPGLPGLHGTRLVRACDVAAGQRLRSGAFRGVGCTRTAHSKW